jgi:hypothetical protein
MPNDAPSGGGLVRRESGALSTRSAALIDRGLRELEAMQSGFAEAVLSRGSLLDLIAGVVSFLPDDPASLEVDEHDFAEIEIGDGHVAMRAETLRPGLPVAVEIRATAEVRKEGRFSLETSEIYGLRDGVASLPDSLVTLSVRYHPPMTSSFDFDPDWRERSAEDVTLLQKLKADSQSAGEDVDRRMEAVREYAAAYMRVRNATLHLRAREKSYAINVSTRREKLVFDWRDWRSGKGELKTWTIRGRDLTEVVQRTAHAVARPPDPRSGTVLKYLLFDLGPDRLRLTGASSHILARAQASVVGGSEVVSVLDREQLLKFVGMIVPDETVTICTYVHYCDQVWLTGSRIRLRMSLDLFDDPPSYDAKFPTEVHCEAIADRLALVAAVREAAAGGTGDVSLMIDDGEAEASEWPSDCPLPNDVNALVFSPDFLLSQLEHAGGDRILVQICPAPPDVPGGGRMCMIRSSDPVEWVGLVMPLRTRATPSKPNAGLSPVRSDSESYPPISRDLLDQWAELIQEQKRLGLFRPAKQPPVETELGEEDLSEGP